LFVLYNLFLQAQCLGVFQFLVESNKPRVAGAFLLQIFLEMEGF